MNCLLSVVLNKAKKEYENSNVDTKAYKSAIRKTLRICDKFPAFPDVDLIINLSGQMYEKKECCSNIVFLPEQYKDKLDLELKFKKLLHFESSQLRSIRKFLEAVDTNHCLVCQKDGDVIKVVGTSKLSEVKNKLVTLIKIEGHMRWTAKIGRLSLFEYKNGAFGEVADKCEHALKTFKEKFFDEFTGETRIEDKCLVFENIVSSLSYLGHGTSFVIIGNNNKYLSEVRRLTAVSVGHGTELETPKNFGNMKAEEIKQILEQVTKIDGGLLFNVHGKCRAIGCVFDGKVPKWYKNGNSGRGSRYNSVRLYVDNLRGDGFKCIGVIVSDDGSIDVV